MRGVLYAWLLRVYPREFRTRHGQSMRRDYADAVSAVRARGRAAALVTACAWYVDAVRHGIGERMAARRRRAGRIRNAWFQGAAFDIRLAVRRLAREPGFAVFAVLTLALGIGGTASVFTFYNAAFLRTLPWPDGEALVRIEMVDERGRGRARVSLPDAIDFGSATGVAGVGVVDYGAFALAGGAGDPEVVRGASASASLFTVLRAGAARGRLFTAEDARNGGVAVLSDGLWRRRFGADPDIVGQAVLVQDRSTVIIGVLPADFVAPEASLDGAPELWVPLAGDGPLAERGVRWLQGIGRLQPGVSIGAGTTALTAVAERLAAAFPQTNEGLRARAVPLRQAMWGDLRAPMLVVLSAACFVLLIACANLANLLMARATTRSREMAVRSALGAGRLRIARQLLLEHGVLAVLGACAGAGLLLVVRGIVQTTAGGRLPLLMAAPVDWRVLGMLAVLAALVALAFGLVPLSSTAGAADALREGRGNTQGRSGMRARRVLIGAQVTLCFVLLVAAGLLMRGFQRLTRVDPGFDAERVLSFELSLPATRYADAAAVLAFQAQLLEQLAAIPGVQAVGIVDKLPLGTRWGCEGLLAEGMAAPSDDAERAPCGDLRSVSDGYFEAMGISITAGRGFTPAGGTRPDEVLVNQTLAARLWPGEDVAGRRIAWANDGIWRTIVGVVEDVRHRGPLSPAFPEVYVPHQQAPDGRAAFVVRADASPLALGPAVRQVVARADPRLPMRNLQSLDAALSASIAGPRAGTIAMSVLGTFALFLAAVGLYGVLAFLVAHRAPEIGIRIALGAQRRDIIRLVVGEGLRTVAVAIVIGALISLAAAQAARGLLFGADPVDPIAFVAVGSLLLLVALLASWQPARQAIRTKGG